MPIGLVSVYRLGGVGLIVYGALLLVSGVLDLAAGTPPSTGAEILAWIGARHRLLVWPSEILFFQAAFLVPGVIALYESLAGTDRGKAAAGCGILGIAVSLMAFMAVVHGRLVFPVYGIRVQTPDVAAFAVGLYYGGLHAISLLVAVAAVFLGLAMRRGAYGKRVASFGFVTGAVAIAWGYPYLIGPIPTLACQAWVAAWFVVVGRKLWGLGHGK